MRRPSYVQSLEPRIEICCPTVACTVYTERRGRLVSTPVSRS